MKKIYIFLIIISQLSCNSSISQKNGWTKYKVNGKVEEMLTKSYSAIKKNGNIEADESNQIYYEDNVFDSAGYITESFVEKANWLFIYVYKKGSNQLLYTSNPFINKLGAKDTIIYTDGVPDSIITKDKDGNVYNTIKLKVDSEGNIIERVKRDTNSKLVEIIKSKYKNGVCVSESIMDSTNRLLRKMESELGANGRIKSTRIFNDKEELLYATFDYYDLDEFGNWTKKLEYDKSGKVVRITKRGFMYYGKKYKNMGQAPNRRQSAL